MKNSIVCASVVVAAASLLSPAVQAWPLQQAQPAPHAPSAPPAQPAQAAAAQAPALAFPAASPAATISQRVGLTDIEIKYSRPGAKGRAIFGKLIPFGEVWRTGANAATKVSFSTDVTLGGKPVPAGTYALFTIPGQSEWMVILNKVADQSGAFAYDAAQDLLRVTAPVTALPKPVESFTIGFDDVGIGSAALTLSWEKTEVRVPIGTDVVGQMGPKIQAAMAAEGKKPWFQAAMFYYENDLDMAQAVKWMDAAVKEQADPPVWMVYRQGLVLKKAGDKAGALAAAKRSLELAGKAGGELGAEYKRLNEELIAELK
jgi:Protein of unknown function (DUF2911)